MEDKKWEGPKAVIVLAMHGAPPLDFPREEMTEFMSLYSRIGHSPGPDAGAQGKRYKELELKMRAWPRTGQNDPFYAGSQDLARQLQVASGLEVIIGFNEFCAPALDDALEGAATREAETVIVITTMMTRGGEHSAIDIPEAIRRVQQKFPSRKIVYAWPFPTEDIARFLSSQITRFL